MVRLSPCRHEGTKRVVTLRRCGLRWTLFASGDLHPAKRGKRTAKSCGPGAATLASIRPACAGSATGARKAVPRGEREVSRQTIARGKPGCPGCTCQTRVHFPFATDRTRTIAGAAGARLSLRPPHRREQRIDTTRAKTCRGNAGDCLTPSRRARAAGTPQSAVWHGSAKP